MEQKFKNLNETLAANDVMSGVGLPKSVSNLFMGYKHLPFNKCGCNPGNINYVCLYCMLNSINKYEEFINNQKKEG